MRLHADLLVHILLVLSFRSLLLSFSSCSAPQNVNFVHEPGNVLIRLCLNQRSFVSESTLYNWKCANGISRAFKLRILNVNEQSNNWYNLTTEILQLSVNPRKLTTFFRVVSRYWFYSFSPLIVSSSWIVGKFHRYEHFFIYFTNWKVDQRRPKINSNIRFIKYWRWYRIVLSMIRRKINKRDRWLTLPVTFYYFIYSRKKKKTSVIFPRCFKTYVAISSLSPSLLNLGINI